MFTEEDKITLKNKNISLDKIEEQLDNFKTGFPFLEIKNIATINDGIQQLSEKDKNHYIETWDKYLKSNHQIVKFVPASGAASRMFKDLFSFLEENKNSLNNPSILQFFTNIKNFAFYDDLNNICLEKKGKSLDSLLSTQEYTAIVDILLNKDGLNYGNLPKGLLKFHKYSTENRTSVQEHLVEGSIYTKSGNNNTNIHFTVSPEHLPLFKDLINKTKTLYEKEFNTTYNIEFSEQKQETDTIAVDLNNSPFRENEKILFRPGGHGALIENLNDINADIIFIKNIDNVIPDRLKDQESSWKKALAGFLIQSQEKSFKYLSQLESGDYDRNLLLEILQYLQSELHTRNPETKHLEDAELVLYIKSKLNRPFRVCGMVKNVGEPGGGPFFTVNKDKTVSLQILESSQIDFSKKEYKDLFESGTHFNPVDIVCGIKNYKDEKFNLKNYIDSDTGFISQKSKNGKELKALELPGLWNGAMSDWNTIFIEVPLSTFNPVKTVNDLLRKEHQNS